MDTNDVKKYIEKQKQSFICKVLLNNKEYFQAIKERDNKFQFLYYKTDGEKIYLEDNIEILKKLSNKYELTFNDIFYTGNQPQFLEGKKVESEELRDWIKEFASDELENCELFVSIYGKDFARERMQDLKNAYIEEKNESTETIAGCQRGNSEITIIDSKKGDNQNSIADIKKDKDKKQTVIHESVHLVLRHNEGEDARGCTGMVRVIICIDQRTNKNKKIEIGRGLNEGLTEWITEQCGYKESRRIYYIN